MVYIVEDQMKLLYRYLIDHWGSIVLFLFCNVFLISVFLLYGITLEIVLYPVLICDFFCIGHGIVCFLKHKKRYYQISNMNEPAYIDEKLYPVWINDIERQEFCLIQKMRDELQETNIQNEKVIQDMLDYYTVWVHQIKTPIAAMKLRLQNEDSPLSRKLQTDLFRIEQYVEMVLAYLRLSSNQTDYLFQKYDMDVLLKRVIRKYADEFIERKITLDYQPVHLQVITDEKWIGFVFEQVLSNALKYTPKGQIRIYCADSDTVCIEDSGIGIRKEDLPRVFENGFTGYNGRLSPQASGLGLYLCKQVCLKLHHEIEAFSEIGNGTKIYIHFLQNTNLTQM